MVHSDGFFLTFGLDRLVFHSFHCGCWMQLYLFNLSSCDLKKIHSFIFAWFFDLFNFTSHFVQFQYLISSFRHHFNFPFLGDIFSCFFALVRTSVIEPHIFSAVCCGSFCPIVLISAFCKTFLIVAPKNLRFLGGSLGLLV